MSETNSKSEVTSARHLEAGSEGRMMTPESQMYDNHGRLLVPQPMSDANDPLNWSSVRKITIITTVAAWTFLGTFHMIIVGSAFFNITAELDNAFALTTYLVGGPLLSYGVASLFWVAAGNRFGVRFCFFFSAIVAGCFSIWGAKAASFGQLVVARTLASIAFASPETLGPQVVADVFFLKDRAKCMAFVTSMQASGFAIGPLVGGFIVRDLGWRWTQWIMVILTFGVAVIIFCFFPETQYTSDLNYAVKERRLGQEFRFTRVSGGGRAKVHSFVVAFSYPFRYLRHPVVVIVTVYFSLYLLVTSYILTTQSISYSVVYRFSVGSTALTFFAPLLGVLAGMSYCGFQDTYLHRVTKPCTFQPEERLPFLIVSCAIGIAGTILFGTCTQNQCHWLVPLIGTFGNLFGFICANSITFAYLVDVYLARGDATLVIVNGFKNIAAFGISYAIIPWNTNAGYAVPLGVLTAIVAGAHLLMVGLWWKGQVIREWTAGKYDDAKETHHGEVF